MNLKLKKILFATDFSEASQAALAYATSLARDTGALLIIAHVEEPPVSYASGEMLVIRPDVPNAELDRMLTRIAPAGLRYEHHLVIGNPADEIVRLAEEQHADLIIVGTHGRRGLSRLLTGSVAELVLRRAECPVLAVKAAGRIASIEAGSHHATKVST
jgi:nucleotide-binding universal stress UspA family protein